MRLNKNKEILDHFLTKESFFLEYDSRYKMFRTLPKPDYKDLHSYYKAENYVSHQQAARGFFDKTFFFFKSIMIGQKIKIINKLFSKPSRSFDIGSGTGDFVAALSTKGWEAYGYEPSVLAKAFSKKRGVVHLKSLSEGADNSFELITFWHSLEHVYSLENTISEVNRLLKPGGVLLVACPNFNSWDAKYYKNYWAAWDVPRHLRHFSLNSLELLLEPLGYKQHGLRPLLLDAFYVSMLSEKIKGNRFYFLKGIIIGFVSNFLALFNKNYSSSVFVFRKS